MTATTTIRTTPPIAGAGVPPTADAWSAAFAQALPYDAFLTNHATPDQRTRWEGVRGCCCGGVGLPADPRGGCVR